MFCSVWFVMFMCDCGIVFPVTTMVGILPYFLWCCSKCWCDYFLVHVYQHDITLVNTMYNVLTHIYFPSHTLLLCKLYCILRLGKLLDSECYDVSGTSCVSQAIGKYGYFFYLKRQWRKFISQILACFGHISIKIIL